MAFESLLDDAFQRGCGISRSHALRTSRYKELAATGPRVPYTTRAETAEMIYLGERLADRAFANLPFSLRERAKRWPEMNDLERRQLLNALMTRLTSKKWRAIGTGRDQATYNLTESALPAACGSWSRGKIQPNCLGMAQMLIGFARATGAEHMMVDTIARGDHHREYLYYRTLTQMLKKLARYRSDPGIARTIKRLEVARNQSLKVLVSIEESHQAHHALVIKLGESWVVVDPYLGAKYDISERLKHRMDQMHRMQQKAPRYKLMVSGGQQDRMDQFMAIRTLESALWAYARRGQPRQRLSGINRVSITSNAYAWIGVPTERKELTKQELRRAWEQTLTHCLLSKPQYDQLVKSGAKKTPFNVDELIKHTERNKRARDVMLGRLVKFGVTVCVRTCYDMTRSQKREHRCIELSHPTYHLAIMTLNHLGGATDQPVAELVRFSNAQWIIHDTLSEVATSGDAKLQRIIDARLENLGKYPSMMLPDLLAHLNHRKEES